MLRQRLRLEFLAATDVYRPSDLGDDDLSSDERRFGAADSGEGQITRLSPSVFGHLRISSLPVSGVTAGTTAGVTAGASLREAGEPHASLSLALPLIDSTVAVVKLREFLSDVG